MINIKLKCLLLLLIFFIESFEAQCQKTHGSLAIQKFSEVSPKNELLLLETAQEDTNKVNLLIKISSIYWPKKSVSNIYLDSALFFARKAILLSAKLNDINGHNESCFIACKTLMAKSDLNEAKKILTEVYGEEHIRLLLVIGEYYSFLPGDQGKSIDKAIPFIKAALSESDNSHSFYWKAQCLELMGKIFFEKGDLDKGRQYFFQIINYYKSQNDTANQANYWHELAIYLPATDANYSLVIKSFKESIRLYIVTNDKKNAAYAMNDMADEVYAHDLDSAENLYLRTIEILKSAGVNKLYRIYLSLSEAYQNQGNFSKALVYALLGLKNMELLHDEREQDIADVLLGNIYRELNEPKQSTDYYKMGLDLAGTKTRFSYIIVKYYVDGLIQQKKSYQALNFIKAFIVKRPAESSSEQAIIASSMGDWYKGIGNLKMAEYYYLEMIRFLELARINKRKEIFESAYLSDAEAYYEISKFYADNKKFKKMNIFLQKASTLSNLTPLFVRDFKYLQFKSDSAAGEYIKAINNYERNSFLKDSILRAEQLKELTQNRVQFETAEKEKNIQLLEKEGQLQKKDLKSANQLKFFTFSGIIGLIFLLIILYNRYKLKQKSNVLLKEQKEIINRKNSKLVDLVREKEWLLKEVHHRVKNNLQVVMSLLHSQSAYLKDEMALNAVMDSRRRVQAMSLIHQKLYKSDNSSSIYMPEYIGELIEYLKDSFKTGLKVIFKLDVAPISMDVLHAIPIGLILNEIITNALKYAFPYTESDTILVKLEKGENEIITLLIADNGRGLPADFNIEETDSFGMILVKGLVEDLGGSLMIESIEGTIIHTRFNATLSTNEII